MSSAKGALPGGGNGCIYRPVKEEDVNVDLGNNFTTAIPPPACTGDIHVIDQSTLTPRSPYWTGDQSTSASAPLCDKRLVVLNNGQNANADFHLMTNFRDRSQRDGCQRHAHRRRRGARPDRRPGLQRHLLRAQPELQLVRRAAADRQHPDRHLRPRRHGAGGLPRWWDDVRHRQGDRADGPGAPTVTYDANNWRLHQDRDDERRRRLRGDPALDRDVQLPDPAGTLPRHVHGHRGRPGHQGAPECQLQPEPTDRDHAGRGLARPDRPARHADRPDLGHGVRGPGRRHDTRPVRPRAP